MFRFFRRWRKYARLHSLSRRFASIVLEHSRIGSVEELLAGGDDDLKIVGEALALVEQDTICSDLMSQYGANSQTLDRIFWALMDAGAGQPARDGLFIPFVALVEPWALEYLLKRGARGIGENEAFRLVVFYQDRKGLEWLRD